MGLGPRRSEQQDAFRVSADKLGIGPRNAFFDRLNELPSEIEFDWQLDAAVEPYDQKTDRKGLPPSVDFRMIFRGNGIQPRSDHAILAGRRDAKPLGGPCRKAFPCLSRHELV